MLLLGFLIYVLFLSSVGLEFDGKSVCSNLYGGTIFFLFWLI